MQNKGLVLLIMPLISLGGLIEIENGPILNYSHYFIKVCEIFKETEDLEVALGIVFAMREAYMDK